MIPSPAFYVGVCLHALGAEPREHQKCCINVTTSNKNAHENLLTSHLSCHNMTKLRKQRCQQRIRYWGGVYSTSSHFCQSNSNQAFTVTLNPICVPLLCLLFSWEKIILHVDSAYKWLVDLYFAVRCKVFIFIKKSPLNKLRTDG
jgi:hypothetical protein